MRTPRLPLAALATILVSATSHVARAATYYVSSAIGSDSHTAQQAQQEATPWAHLPGKAANGGGCSCRITGHDASSSAALAMLLMGAAFIGARWR